jgi:hypothetical protein
MGWLSSPKAPDTSGINNAAVMEAKTGQDALDWFKSTYADTADERAAATARDAKIADAQIAGMEFANTEAQAAAARRRQTEGREDQLIADAQAYDTPERRAAARAEAAASVEGAAGRAQQAQTRQFARQGMDLTGPQSAALSQDANLQKTKLLSGATYAADRNVEQQGYARKMDAVNLTKGIGTTQATQQQIATQAGTAGAAATGSGLQATYSGVPMMQTGFNTALNATQASGNLYGTQAQLQSGGGNNLAGAMSGVGSIMQGIGAIYGSSSKRVKMDKQPVSDDEALEAVNSVPVEKWKYRPGMGDEGAHVGPYAEDVQQTMGDEVAPDGAAVNLNAMQANNGQALKALAAELAELEAQVAALTQGAQRSAKKPARERARMH